MTVTRRVFVKAGALGLVSFGLDPLFLDRAVYAAASQARKRAGSRTLVCLFQRGAVDGLSMVIPYGDASYYRERPRIAIPRSAVVDLDGYWGLHPRLAPLVPLWKSGSLALIPAVGSPDGTRSHFDAQDYMESGTPGVKSTADGWLNRQCQHDQEHTATPFRAVAMGAQLPRILAGTAPTLAIDDLRSFGIRDSGGAGLTQVFEQLYGGASTGLVASSSQEGFEAVRMLRTANPSRHPPSNGAEYPRGKFGEALRQIAQLIKADLGVEIAFADLGGWDTHVNQGADQGQLAARLDELARGLAAFTTDLGERMRDVLVLTMSEFGRTVRENGTGGSDHGHGTTMMVLGGEAAGGKVHGRWPGLDPAERYQGRDVPVTTDFRGLFGEVLVKHLGATDLSAVFPGYGAGSGGFPGVMRG